MKNSALILISILALACSDDETTYSVTPELDTYVTSFFTEGEQRGKTIPKTNLIVHLNSECQAITQVKQEAGQWILEFDKEAFEAMSAQGNPNNKIESFLFHELGRIVLKRELSDGHSIMNGDIKVNGFSDDEREELLNELFK
ncbi:MAG TPA: hypothetical protein VD884_13305 [Ohtaekwangia sp.]|nr:hypothetical protein [Ohtaekwangia sp.]